MGDQPLTCDEMPRTTVTAITERMRREPGRLFTYADFADLPATAVAPALSRLRARGEIKRAWKGVYYIPRQTALGEVPPDSVAVGVAASRGEQHPAGLSAASALGLTTQVPARVELAIKDRRPTPTSGVAFKRRIGTDRGSLLPIEVALLEVLRDIKNLSDLPPDETIVRLQRILEDEAARRRITRAAVSEPPRVRAMVGALTEALGTDASELVHLRKTLNPMTRYDFGTLSELPTARRWGAK